jgi:hypothetical protein
LATVDQDGRAIKPAHWTEVKGKQMTTYQKPLQQFVIRVGFWEVRLKAHDAEEAIRLARLQMARELPRLYDVIHQMTPARFQVEAAA